MPKSTAPRALAICAAIATLALSACAQPTPVGETATWEVRGEPDATSTLLEIEVTRLACSSGVTGEVLPATVSYEPDRVIIDVTVAPLSGDVHSCQGNDAVVTTVQLGEPLGNRELVDAACLDTEARNTTFCTEGGVRWSP